MASRSYYDWKSKTVYGKELKAIFIKKKINAINLDKKQRYGSPRITAELNALGIKVSRVTVAKYMKQMGLRSKLSRKYKVTTDSKHSYLIKENVLDRKFKVTDSSKVWVSNINYIHTKEGFLYY